MIYRIIMVSIAVSPQPATGNQAICCLSNTYSIVQARSKSRMKYHLTRMHRSVLLASLLLLQLSCDFIGDSNARVKDSATDEVEYKTIEWTELMPEEDLQALLNPPEHLNDIEEGSSEDQRLYQQLAAGKTAEKSDSVDRYQQALLSTDFRAEFDNQYIRIAGYLVPLEFEHSQVVTQALLVPYFGACIHLPPPPPNQVILLHAPEGITLGDMYQPYWMSGIVKTTLHQSELATSAYEMNVASYELYTD